MKTFEELNNEQRFSLKQRLLCQREDGYVGYGDLTDVDLAISDEELEKEYGGTMFSEEDF